MAIKNVGTTITDTQDKSEQVDILGAMPYQAGIWDATTEYIRDEKSYPVVEYSGQHYRLNRFGTVTGGDNPSKDYADNGVNASWILADQSEMYIIGALFAKFAKLNDFIFSGSKMSSQQGNGNDYTAEGFVPNLMLNAKDGSAKFGDMSVDETGMIYVKDPITDIIRFAINAQDTPSIQSLLSGLTLGGSTYNMGVTEGWGIHQLPQSLTVDENGSDITIVTTLSALVDGGDVGMVTAELQLKSNVPNSPTFILGRVTSNQGIGLTTIQINKTLKAMPAGTYSLVLDVSTKGSLYIATGTVGESTMSWLFVKDIQRFLFGLNGLLAFYPNHHMGFDKDKGLDIRGKTNMPGVLASGTVNTNGGLMNEWGAKVNYGQTITGGYRIFLKDMTHNQYSVQVTPHTATTFRVSTKTIGYFDILGTGAADFVVFGRNY